MRHALLAFLLVFLLAPAQADLADLLQWQRQGDSGAYVSSGFYDWRGLSKYRSRPGLHAGYDIAMLPGSAVRTPWSGQVVAITPWYGNEVGVTVLLSNGWEATFGHITSAVAVGQRLQRGDTVGWVVVDHVDVKVRDQLGFVDFAKQKIANSSQLAIRPSPRPQRSQEQLKAAAKAFDEYQRLLADLAEIEAMTRLGLLPDKASRERTRKLEALRPLASLHAELKGEKLPRKGAAPTLESDSGRPLTDYLLSDFPQKEGTKFDAQAVLP
jgi:hypothetical protein